MKKPDLTRDTYKLRAIRKYVGDARDYIFDIDISISIVGR